MMALFNTVTLVTNSSKVILWTPGYHRVLTKSLSVHLWPWFSKDIDTMTSKWLICCKYNKQNAEPLKPNTLYQWQWVADLWINKTLVVNYYLCYTKITSLRIPNLSAVIQKLKTAFALRKLSVRQWATVFLSRISAIFGGIYVWLGAYNK